MTRPGRNNGFLTGARLAELGFASVGEGSMVHELAVIHGADTIHLGRHARIDAFAVLSATSSIVLGDYAHVGAHCSVVAAAPVLIGDFCNISHGTVLLTITDDFAGTALLGAMVPLALRRPQIGAIELTRHVAIGSNTVILPGVTAGEGSAVGALSLVKQDLEPWMLYAGIPARARAERSRNALLLESRLSAKPGTPGSG